MKTFARIKAALETLSTVVVIAAAVALLWTIFFKKPEPAVAAAPPKVQEVQESIPAPRLTNVMGSGPLAIVEFTDFQCPFCKRHATETLPVLLKEIAGKARYVSLHLPLQMHQQAVPAAEAAECAAEQGKFWEMHAALFGKQSELGSHDYASLAREVGADVERFDACRAAGKARARVSAS